MFCRKCGKEISESLRFCPACGQPVRVESGEIKTPPQKEGTFEAKVNEPEEIKYKFCTKCGGPLDESGNCTVCYTAPTKKEVKKQERQTKREAKQEAKRLEKKEKWQKLSVKQKTKKICLKFVAILLVLLFLAAGATVALVHFKVVDVPFVENALNFVKRSTKGTEAVSPEELTDKLNEENLKKQEMINTDIQTLENGLTITPIDADAYYRDNSTVISETAATASTAVRSETDVCRNMVERGFTEHPVETSYSINGEFYESIEVSASSSEKHPIYQTYYASADGSVWVIFEINGAVMANPVSYNMQSGREVQVIISETEKVISYDNMTNKFYETIPNESELIVKTVTRIDAETLEKLTYGEINRL